MKFFFARLLSESVNVITDNDVGCVPVIDVLETGKLTAVSTKLCTTQLLLVY